MLKESRIDQMRRAVQRLARVYREAIEEAGGFFELSRCDRLAVMDVLSWYGFGQTFDVMGGECISEAMCVGLACVEGRMDCELARGWSYAD